MGSAMARVLRGRPLTASRAAAVAAVRLMGFAGPGGGSLSGAAVDALAQQVGMARVPGILLDHVDQDVADTH